MKTPDITRAQIGALLVIFGGQAVAWGLLSGRTEQLVLAIASTVAGVAWKFADAWIRHGRSKVAAVAALEQLVLEQATKPPAPAA